MHQPPDFRDPRHPNHVCHLHRSLCGLKQALGPSISGSPNTLFVSYLTTFSPSHPYSSIIMKATLRICYYMWMILY